MTVFSDITLPCVPLVTVLVRTSSTRQQPLIIHYTAVKQLLAGEETLLAEVAVEDGEEDHEEPDHQDHPQFLILVHLILDNTTIWLKRAKLGTFQDPFRHIGNMLQIVVCFSNATKITWEKFGWVEMTLFVNW